MKIRTSLIIIALACCAPALAEFELVTLVNAVETAPANIILPASLNGMVTYRPCAEACDEEYERARLTADTKFTIDGTAVNYADFKTFFAEVRHAENSYALVSVDIARVIVTSIDLAR